MSKQFIRKESKLVPFKDLFNLIKNDKLILGPEVLSSLDCEYKDTIKQRNFNRNDTFIINLINAFIFRGKIGGNIWLYELQNGKILAIDGRTRLMALHKAMQPGYIIDLNKIDDGSRSWAIEYGYHSCTKCSFAEYPEAAKNQIIDGKIEVIYLSYKDTTIEEAREIFVSLNKGIQKVNKAEMSQNIHYGACTLLIEELYNHEYLRSTTCIIQDSHILNNSANIFIGFILQQAITGIIGNINSLNKFLASYKIMSNLEKKSMLEKFETYVSRVKNLFDNNIPASYRAHGSFFALLHTLHNLDINGVNYKSKKIKNALITFDEELRSYNHLTFNKKGKRAENIIRWHYSKGHDRENNNIKLKKAGILRSEVIMPILTPDEKSKLNADFPT